MNRRVLPKFPLAALVAVGLPSAACLTAGLPAAGAAEGTGKTRDEMVRDDLSDWGDEGEWIYNDLEAGLAEAKRTGKPVMAVLRCIP